MTQQKRILSVYLPHLSEELRKRAISGQLEAPPDPETDLREREALLKFARWAYRFSPITCVDAPPDVRMKNDPRFYGINLDVTGCERLFSSLQTIAEQIRSGLTRGALTSQIAIAPTLGAAWAASRYGTQSILTLSEKDLRSLLAPLPVAALRLTSQTVEALRELNIREIGELFVLPRTTLLPRFGAEPLKRLNQALGIEEELLQAVKPRQPLKLDITFHSPTSSLATLERATRMLLEQILTTLAAQHKKIATVVLTLKPYGAKEISRTIPITIPSADEKHLWSLLGKQLELLHASTVSHDLSRSCDGIESLSLCAAKVVNTKPQRTTFLRDSAPVLQDLFSAEDFGQLLDTLTERLGAERILSIETQASHIPEEAFRYLALRDKIARSTNPSSPYEAAPSATQMVAAERPSIIFRSPYPIKAMAVMPDGPPFWLKWRETVFQIQTTFGPERIAPEWWRRTHARSTQTRDYFKVQLQSGAWLWIYREIPTSLWFVHGIWA